MKLFYLLSLLVISVTSHPGLLRVPKVYNAVITSNQNLSPSRAYPVIQPVIHRTAVGYVPPLYYTQIAPHFSGPEVVHVPRLGATVKDLSDSIDAEEPVKTNNGIQRQQQQQQQREEEVSPQRNQSEGEEETANEKIPNGPKEDSKRKQQEEEPPLSFYPNYHSLYYDPYFYTYNTFNPHLIPGTYYVDYRPFSQVAPISPPSNKQQADLVPERLLPGYHEETKDNDSGSINETREKIPDVPPPPVPTSLPKSSS